MRQGGFFHFFQRLDARLRGWLSRRPFLYAFLGAVGVILFWRGVWHGADFFAEVFFATRTGLTTIDAGQGIDSLVSLLIGMLLLLITGLFVVEFIAGEVLISGLKGEKQIAGKTEEEVKEEASELVTLEREIKEIAAKVDHIDQELEHASKHST